MRGYGDRDHHAGWSGYDREYRPARGGFPGGAAASGRGFDGGRGIGLDRYDRDFDGGRRYNADRYDQGFAGGRRFNADRYDRDFVGGRRSNPDRYDRGFVGGRSGGGRYDRDVREDRRPSGFDPRGGTPYDATGWLPFSLAPFGYDPTLGWAGWGAGTAYVPLGEQRGAYRPAPPARPRESPLYGRGGDRGLRRWAERYGYDVEFTIRPRR